MIQIENLSKVFRTSEVETIALNQGLFKNVDEKRSVQGRENCRLLRT